jgi:hypothetical protein
MLWSNIEGSGAVWPHNCMRQQLPHARSGLDWRRRGICLQISRDVERGLGAVLVPDILEILHMHPDLV